ncbi:MAG: hypothetical protein QME96_17725, partial [Myxococcota bacterium]|nr:hypothetical protein [Myxococcota bacterium]
MHPIPGRRLRALVLAAQAIAWSLGCLPDFDMNRFDDDVVVETLDEWGGETGADADADAGADADGDADGDADADADADA